MMKTKRVKTAAAIVGAALLLCGAVVRAGEWQVSKTYNGAYTLHRDADPPASPTPYDLTKQWNSTNFPTGWLSDSYINKVGAEAKAEGSVSFSYQWVPGYMQTLQSDPAPAWLFLRIVTMADAQASSDTNGTYRNLFPETVDATATYATAQVVPWTHQTEVKAQTPTFPPALSPYASGSGFVSGPTLNLLARASIPGGRIKTFPGLPGGVALTGQVYAFANADAMPIIVTPSPSTRALDGNPLNGYNEFTMIGDGVPFRIETNIAFNGPGVDSYTIEHLRQYGSWTISRPLPNPITQ